MEKFHLGATKCLGLDEKGKNLVYIIYNDYL